MKSPLRQQLKNQDLPEEELTDAEQQLLQKVLDRELSEKWAQNLAQQGVHRQVAPKLRLFRRQWLAVAASLLLVVAAWWLWNSANPKAQRLADNYLNEPFGLSSTTFRDDSQLAPQRKTALEAYQNRRYEAALSAVQSLITANQAQAADYFLAGLCYLYQPNPDYTAAAGYLSQARSLDPSKFNDEIAWYLSLAYIKLKDYKKASFELNQIINSNTSRQIKEAKNLLNLIRSS